MGVSRNHIRRLVGEADMLGKKARWRYGREILDLSPVDTVLPNDWFSCALQVTANRSARGNGNLIGIDMSPVGIQVFFDGMPHQEGFCHHV